MWRSIGVVTLLAALALLSRESRAASNNFLPPGEGRYNQWFNNAVRDYMESRQSKYAPNAISGQVSLRSPRSELGNMALYQLYELDRIYGQKARPRFGKRSEIYSAEGNPSPYLFDKAGYDQDQAEAPTSRRR